MHALLATTFTLGDGDLATEAQNLLTIQVTNLHPYFTNPRYVTPHVNILQLKLKQIRAPLLILSWPTEELIMKVN